MILSRPVPFTNTYWVSPGSAVTELECEEALEMYDSWREGGVFKLKEVALGDGEFMYAVATRVAFGERAAGVALERDVLRGAGLRRTERGDAEREVEVKSWDSAVPLDALDAARRA